MVQKKKTKQVSTPVESAEVVEKTQEKRPTKKLTLIILMILTIILWGCVFYLAWDRYMKPERIPGGDAQKVVAVVAGEPVTLSDVYEMASSIPQLNELPFEMIYPQILENIVNMKVMLKGAKEMGLEKDPKVKQALELARDQILSQAYLNRRLEASVTPEKLKALYDEEIKQYQPEEQVHAKHILVKTLKEAKDIVIQLKAGADFALLAGSKSLDTSAVGGDLGTFTKNMMPPEFGNAVFSMKAGELSEPIKTPFGWHVVLVEEKSLTTPPSFEEVQEQLQQLYMEKNAAQILNEARSAANVKILQPSLKKPDMAPKGVAAAPTVVVEQPEAVTEQDVSEEPLLKDTDEKTEAGVEKESEVKK